MPNANTIPIKVSSRVLRHISRGIYRTPAGALKELISNAYDAGAREVTITTGWPTIAQIVITDDGKGMSADEFKDIVQHIGFSEKSLGDEVTVPGTRIKRRTIGHYGIGLLAVGQLASAMKITSKPKGVRRGFTADLDFEQFEVIKEDAVKRSRIKDEAAVERKDRAKRRDQAPTLSIGSCRIQEDKYDSNLKGKSFTRITLTGIREFVYKHLSGDLAELNPDSRNTKAYSANFFDLLATLRQNEANVQLGWYPYERLIWEMGVYCPVPYPNIGPFAKGGELASIAQLAHRPKFSLRIDGIRVRKPFEPLFFEDGASPVEKIFTWHNKPLMPGANAPRTSGYLLFKRQIRPKAIQGILVRENGVAVGLYDTTYLHYPFNEGQKFNQLTGEIYATGLSGALNIDRNSFNETDDIYISLCAWFHRTQLKQVFARIKDFQKSELAPRRKENRAAIQATLASAAPIFGGKLTRVRFASFGKTAPLLKVQKHSLLINQDHADGSGSGSSREKTLLAAALVLRGLVTPAELEEVEQAIRAAKRETRASK